jgi:hypothetical protein
MKNKMNKWLLMVSLCLALAQWSGVSSSAHAGPGEIITDSVSLAMVSTCTTKSTPGNLPPGRLCAPRPAGSTVRYWTPVAP